MDASVNRIPSSQDERAFLIAIRIKGRDQAQAQAQVSYSLKELNLLVKTAGATVAGERTVTRERIDPSTIVGRGFLETIREIIAEENITLIVFDLVNIRPAQIRNLEDNLKCRIVGRNEIILDIFARRARSSEAKIQVELAQLRYILPRLKGLGGVLSRLGGGIGTRGPGEKMLETDRRHILRRISTLDKKLDRIKKHRERTRSRRSRECIGAVVGYTNAGKSTLINLLAHDDLFVENRLFATLDAYTRTVFLSEGKKALLTDTVGFIRNLPANLLESFKSTLEEIVYADFLIHVIDINSIDMETSVSTVEKELNELECSAKPAIIFFSKADMVTDEAVRNRIGIQYPGAIIGSSMNGEGIDELRERMNGMYDMLARTGASVSPGPESE